MSHTPGPWSLEYDYSLVINNHIVSAGPIGPDETTREEKIANAKLIASAPDLLEALQSCLNWAKNGNQEHLIVFEAAQAAIDKATK